MNGDNTWPLQEAGQQAAIDALNAEKGINDSGRVANVKHILQDWIDNKETLSQEYARAGDYVLARLSQE